MEYLKYAKKLSNSIKHEVLIEWSFFLVFMGVLILINMHDYLFFHTAIELFINFIFIMVFVFTSNTYSINKNNFLLILGTGYFFVGALGILHLLTYEGMPFINPIDAPRITIMLWICARYLEVFTCIISMVALAKNSNNINPYAIFIVYLCITAFLLSLIFIFKIFQKVKLRDMGLVDLSLISKYLLFTVFIGAAIVFSKFRKRINLYLFFCIEALLIFSGAAEIFFANFTIGSEIATVSGHIIKVFAAYFLYKGVVITGLKRPYALINYDLFEADNKLRQFEEIVFNNEQCLKMIINNSDNAISVISDNKFVYANPKIAELLGGKNVEEILGLDVDNILLEEFKNLAHGRINNSICNKVSIPFTESKIMRLDKKVIEIEVSNCFCMYKKNPSVMVMFRDITSKRQIQRLQNDIIENKRVLNKTNELNKMMTEFFSNVSHELKTPLNVILAAIQILNLKLNKIGENSPEGISYKYLKTMKQNCYRLVRLVNNLIDISKFDSGYFKLELHNYNVVNAVEDITLSVADYAKNNGIELLFDTDIEEKYMAIDLDKIERIILNLLSNAIKFTPEDGQILVNLIDKGDKIQISVKDNGVGIPEDKFNIIFERFGQVDKTLTRNKEGSGIGLSLVKSIVDLHGGSINVLSEFGKGSEFIIELPVKLVEDEETSSGRLYESKVEKINIEFADIYS